MGMYARRMPQRLSDADPLSGGALAAFVAAVESGSIHGAADALALTQSATTKRIQHLEQRIGHDLLLRGRHGAKPTQLGQTLYPLAKRALGALAEIGEAAEQHNASRAQTLRLSASLTTGEFLVPAWLGAFRNLRPDIHAQLEIVNSNEVEQRVTDREAEIGFVEGHDSLERFEQLTVGHDQLLVVVAAGHRWARRRSIDPKELKNEPYLSRERRSGMRAVAESALNAVGVSLTPRLEAASLQSLKRAITDGGFTVISELTIEVEQRNGTLIGLPVRGVDLSRDLRAIRLPTRYHTEPATAMWRWLTALPARAEPVTSGPA
jgi:DNA-binding transcriptional LysR family regulator